MAFGGAHVPFHRHHLTQSVERAAGIKRHEVNDFTVGTEIASTSLQLSLLEEVTAREQGKFRMFVESKLLDAPTGTLVLDSFDIQSTRTTATINLLRGGFVNLKEEH